MLEYRVLGVIGARRDGVEIRLSRPLERRLLGLLLVHRDRSVPDSEIIEELWRSSAPANPTAALQTAVSRLRGALGHPESVIRENHGYRLRLDDPESLDAARFERLLDEGLTQEDMSLVTKALDEWSGREPFADLRYDDFARSAIDQLTERRLDGVEASLRHRLQAGDGRSWKVWRALPRLRHLGGAHSLRGE